MRFFLAGLVVGAAIAWLVLSALTPDAPPVAPLPVPEKPGARSEAPAKEDFGATPVDRESVRPGPAVADEAFPPGMAILRIGEGFDFGESNARSGAGAEKADIYCQDIRHGASLRCRNGAVAASVPLAALGLPQTPSEAADLLKDAPRALPQRDVHLARRSAPERTGLALARGKGGKTFKLWLVKEEGHPEALRRRVQIGYAEVPVKKNGGVLDLPTARGIEGGAITQGEIERLSKLGEAVPGMSFGSHIRGSYTRLSEIPDELDLKESRYLLFDDPLTTKVTFNSGGALLAAGGIGREGHVVLNSYSAVAVKGEMQGVVDVKSYGYLHVEGDLTGTVNVDSYATVVIDGDILGTLKVRSYTTLLLRGRVIGTLDIEGSCWSTFLFEQYTSRNDLERMEGDFRQITLHLRDSDLPAGKHKKIGTWREVIVGDPVWNREELR